MWVAHAHMHFFVVRCTATPSTIKDTVVYDTDLALHFLQHKQHRAHTGTLVVCFTLLFDFEIESHTEWGRGFHWLHSMECMT